MNSTVDEYGWYDLHGIFEVFESDSVDPRVTVHFQDTFKGIGVVIDDFLIQFVDSGNSNRVGSELLHGIQGH